MKIGSIEAGGTKFVCSIGTDKLEILNQVSIKTTTPEETMRQVIDYFKKFPEIEKMGIASFGPLDLNPASPKYGFITNTPKPHWENFDLLGTVKNQLNIPTTITSDVNGSVVGEDILLQQRGHDYQSLAYITIGTGVGAGLIVNHQLLGSLGHPEIGHIKVVRHPDDKDFPGICPYHGDCLEGIASGPTFKARLGIPGPEVPLDNPTWQYIAYYIAQAVDQITLIVRPDRIVLGGGVINPYLLKMIRSEYQKLINGYIPTDHLEQYLTITDAQNNNSATIGNLALANEHAK